MTERTPSEQLWLQVTGSLNRDRYDLAVRAADGFPPELRLAGTPLLAPPAWRVPAPVPLESIRLDFRPDTPPPDVPDVAALAPYALPERADGTRYQRYSDVVAALAAPTVFENRPTYRLVEADLAGAAPARGWPSPAAGSSAASTTAARPALSTPPPNAGSPPAMPTAPRSAARPASPGARRRWPRAR